MVVLDSWTILSLGQRCESYIGLADSGGRRSQWTTLDLTQSLPRK